MGDKNCPIDETLSTPNSLNLTPGAGDETLDGRYGLLCNCVGIGEGAWDHQLFVGMKDGKVGIKGDTEGAAICDGASGSGALHNGKGIDGVAVPDD